MLSCYINTLNETYKVKLLYKYTYLNLQYFKLLYKYTYLNLQS